MSAFQHISPPEVRQMQVTGDVQIVDVRDSQSYAWGHIPGATLLTNTNLGDFIQEHEFHTPVVVCCFHGHSSQGVAAYLADQGFEQVYSMDGGYEAWEKAFPTLFERGL